MKQNLFRLFALICVAALIFSNTVFAVQSGIDSDYVYLMNTRMTFKNEYIDEEGNSRTYCSTAIASFMDNGVAFTTGHRACYKDGKLFHTVSGKAFGFKNMTINLDRLSVSVRLDKSVKYGDVCKETDNSLNVGLDSPDAFISDERRVRLATVEELAGTVGKLLLLTIEGESYDVEVDLYNSETQMLRLHMTEESEKLYAESYGTSDLLGGMSGSTVTDADETVLYAVLAYSVRSSRNKGYAVSARLMRDEYYE